MAETAVQFALLVLMTSFVAFMANRLYVGLSKRELNVKGALYSRTTTPILYWVSMSCALLGLLAGLLIGSALAAGLMGLF